MQELEGLSSEEAAILNMMVQLNGHGMFSVAQVAKAAGVDETQVVALVERLRAHDLILGPSDYTVIKAGKREVLSVYCLIHPEYLAYCVLRNVWYG